MNAYWLKYRFLFTLVIMVIYYTVGVVLLLTGGKEGGLIELTPVTIILTTVFLLINHESWTPRIVIAIFSVAILGLSIEIIGINYGIPFGEYSYSGVLGVQLFKTPILIGLNWLMLVYAMVMIVHRYIENNWMKALIACLILVALDILIEPVAINWNMWTWKKSSVPIQNYVTWGIVAFLFSLIISFQLKSSNKNKMALPIILFQFLFFVILGIWS